MRYADRAEVPRLFPFLAVEKPSNIIRRRFSILDHPSFISDKLRYPVIVTSLYRHQYFEMSSKLDYISDTWKDGLFGIHP